MFDFSLSLTELRKLKEWDENEHKCTLTYTGAIGGKFTYSFTPNSMGCVVRVKCACGKEVDLTDYDW